MVGEAWSEMERLGCVQMDFVGVLNLDGSVFFFEWEEESREVMVGMKARRIKPDVAACF